MSTDREILERIDRRSERDSERIEEICDEIGETVKEVGAIKAEMDHVRNQVARNSLMSKDIADINTRLSTIDNRLTNVEDSNRMHRAELKKFADKRMEELEAKQKDIDSAEADTRRWKIRTAVGAVLSVAAGVLGWLLNKLFGVGK